MYGFIDGARLEINANAFRAHLMFHSFCERFVILSPSEFAVEKVNNCMKCLSLNSVHERLFMVGVRTIIE